MYTVTTFVTNDVNSPNGLYPIIWSHYVTPASQSFNTGDYIDFSWVVGTRVHPFYDMAFNGWFVFDANDTQFHRTRLPVSYVEGNAWTANVTLRMDYTGSVIVVAEMT
jgi:hypothetical protein